MASELSDSRLDRCFLLSNAEHVAGHESLNAEVRERLPLLQSLGASLQIPLPCIEPVQNLHNALRVRDIILGLGGSLADDACINIDVWRDVHVRGLRLDGAHWLITAPHQ